MYEIDKLSYLQIGVQGDNESTDIVIDVTAWAEKYPEAEFFIVFKPYNAQEISPMDTRYEDGILTWTVNSAATAVTGVGYTEIRAQDSHGLIKKSRIIPTAVENSVSGVDDTPPAAYQEWVTAVLNAGATAKNAAAAAMAVSEGRQIRFEIGTDDSPTGTSGHLLFYYRDDDDEWAYLDLGAVDAYGMAKAGGYTGTKAEFEEDIGESGTNATAAANNAETAEAFAIGKRNGEDVTSGDAAYHNNSKYWSGIAEAAAATASAAYGTDLLAPAYTDLTFPVKKGDHCIYSGGYYEAKQDIADSEVWTAAHWTQVTVGGESSDLKSAFDVVDAEVNSSTTSTLQTEKNGFSPSTGKGTSSSYTEKMRRIQFRPYMAGSVYTCDPAYSMRFLRYSSDDSSASGYIDCTDYVGNEYRLPLNEAKYLRISIKREDGEDFNGDSEMPTVTEVLKTNLVADLDDRVTILEKYQEPTDVTSLVNVTGGIKASNGTDSTDDTRRRSDYIELKKGSTITYNGVLNTSSVLVAVYNSAKTYDQANSAIAPGGGEQSGVCTMPYDGYVRLCSHMNYLPENGFVIANPTMSRIIALNAEEDLLDARVSVLEDALPDYWETYMQTMIPKIRALDEFIGDHGDSFVFITDTHVPRNKMKSPLLAKRIYKESAVQKLIHGGDLLTIRTDASGAGKVKAVEDMESWIGAVDGLGEIEVIGNHDLNNYNSSNTGDNVLTVSGWYGIVEKHVEKICDTGATPYYVVDNTSQKIRYIILDSEFTTYSDNLSFLETAMAEIDGWSTVSDPWTAVIIQHRYWKNATTADTEGTALETKLASLLSAAHKWELAGVLVGHVHIDVDKIASSLYPIIGVNCDTMDSSPNTYNQDRTAGTTSEQSFDVVHIDKETRRICCTRIGFGPDRAYTYGTGAAKIGTICTGISLDTTSATVNAGGSLQLTATVTPNDTDDTAIRWTSSNTALASVSSGGLVTVADRTINNPQTVYITATRGTVSAYCTITIPSTN